MIIWKKYYNIEVSELNTIQYNKLPKDGKHYYYAGSQDFKEMLEYIISCFGFLIEGFNKTVNAQEFAELIKQSYSLENLKTKYVYEFMLNC